ncbi:MAG: hypothetical protein EBT03_13455, partial [Betaproteobacteria bacterium]|nr:hypothetical protein [Betaproteobacteria bacterium]
LGLTGTAGMATTSSVPSTPEEAKVLEELGVDIITIERETPDAQEIFGDIEVEEGGFGGSTRAEPKFAETYTRFAPDEEPDFFFDDLEMESMRVLGPEERAQLRAEIEEQKAERAERMERIAHNLREQLKAQMEVWHSAEGEKEDAIVEEAYQKLKPALQKVLDVRRPEFYTLPTGERVVRVPPNYLLAQALGMNPNTYNRKLGEARKALLESVGEKVKPPYTGQLAQAYLALAAQGRRVKPKADGESVQIEYDYVDPSTGKVDLAPHEKASVEIAVPFDEARFQSLLRFFRDEQAAREAYDAGMKAPPPVRQRPPKPRPVLALSQGEQEAVGPLKAVPE